MTEASPSTIEHDIAELERLIEEKKAALGHEKSEKEVLHGIVGEKIQQHVPKYQPSSPSVPSSQGAEPPSYQDEVLKDKVQALIKIVFDKNLEEGIKEVSRAGNIAVIDAFHDILVDELYSQLIEKKKLDKVD